MQTLYCLSGLGVDESAFKSFHPKNVRLVHIPWISALKNETLTHYAERLFKSSNLPENYSLIGVSFGGMIAQEFAKIQPPASLFLVSSIQSGKQLPWGYRAGGKLRIHKIIPSKLLTTTTPLSYFLFGTKKREDKRLLREILKRTDPKFLKWAMHAILGWKNDTKHAGIVIHGSNDRILPVPLSSDYVIHGGGHFMIVTHSKQISDIVEKRFLS